MKVVKFPDNREKLLRRLRTTTDSRTHIRMLTDFISKNTVAMQEIALLDKMLEKRDGDGD